jgi:hypothetical protein
VPTRVAALRVGAAPIPQGRPGLAESPPTETSQRPVRPATTKLNVIGEGQRRGASDIQAVRQRPKSV